MLSLIIVITLASTVTAVIEMPVRLYCVQITQVILAVRFSLPCLLYADRIWTMHAAMLRKKSRLRNAHLRQLQPG